MSSLSKLFNALAEKTPSPHKINHAALEFKKEKLQKIEKKIYEEASKVSKLQPIKDLVTKRNTSFKEGVITSKISGNGYNIKVERNDGETNKGWSRRTEQIANNINALFNLDLTTQRTFKNGRIYASTEAGSDVSTIFTALKNAEEYESFHYPLEDAKRKAEIASHEIGQLKLKLGLGQTPKLERNRMEHIGHLDLNLD